MKINAAELYRAGHSATEIANAMGVTPATVIARLRSEGVEIRPPGKVPYTENRGTVTPLIVPRYSCTHPKVRGHTKCPMCDRCQCAPGKRRRTGQRYGGLEACRCGKLIESSDAA